MSPIRRPYLIFMNHVDGINRKKSSVGTGGMNCTWRWAGELLGTRPFSRHFEAHILLISKLQICFPWANSSPQVKAANGKLERGTNAICNATTHRAIRYTHHVVDVYKLQGEKVLEKCVVWCAWIFEIHKCYILMIWIFVMVLGLNFTSFLNTSLISTHPFTAPHTASHMTSMPITALHTASHNLSLPLSLPYPQSSPPVLGRHVLHASAEKFLQRLRDWSPSSADSSAQHTRQLSRLASAAGWCNCWHQLEVHRSSPSLTCFWEAEKGNTSTALVSLKLTPARRWVEADRRGIQGHLTHRGAPRHPRVQATGWTGFHESTGNQKHTVINHHF